MSSSPTRVVDLDKLTIPFAIDINGRWVKAPEVDPAAPTIAPRCPGCGDLVTFRRGSVGRIPHFAHRSGASCSKGGYEGLSHQKLKEATASLIEEVGAGALIHGSEPHLRGLRGAMLEETYSGTDNLRSDVGVTLASGAVLGFEIVVAHELGLPKINQVTEAGNLICAMNGFGFTEHIMQHGGDATFDLDADAKAFVLKWRFTMKRGVPVGTRTAKPANLEYVGGTAVNCHDIGIRGSGRGGGSSPLASIGWSVADGADDYIGASAAPGDLRRQHALRRWHRDTERYPLAFRVHWERGDFNGEEVSIE